jgi:hypothetical protein
VFLDPQVKEKLELPRTGREVVSSIIARHSGYHPSIREAKVGGL